MDNKETLAIEKGFINDDIVIEEEFINSVWVNLPSGERILLKNYLALYIMKEIASLSEDEE